MKNCFTSLSGGSGASCPSTQDSHNTIGSSGTTKVVQSSVGIETMVASLAQAEIANDNTGRDPHGPNTKLQEEQHINEGVGLIMEFNPHIHVVLYPALRLSIERFHPNIQPEVRRAYLLRGPTQPIGHDFPHKHIGNDWRVFHPRWFRDYDCLEYNVAKDVAFCFYIAVFLGKDLIMKNLVMRTSQR